MQIRFWKRKKADSTSPRVGITYLVGGEILIDSTSLDQAGRYGDFRIHERGHIDYWAQLVKSGKVPISEYEEFPRGRVAYYTKSGKFGLLADNCILSQEGIVNKILSQLHIPQKDIDMGTDSHYRCFHCLGHSR
jgi:hypothetical protein